MKILTKPRKTIVEMVGNLAEIQTGFLQNTSIDCNCDTSLLGEIMKYYYALIIYTGLVAGKDTSTSHPMSIRFILILSSHLL